MDGPLEGLHVLELGEALAGPLTCTMLADFGATVVKVERPEVGDSMRRMGPQKNGVGLWWTVTGRGKQSIAIDLKHPRGRTLAHSLATEWADVVVENFRPGVMEKHGLGWDAIHSANPSVSLVRISGYGQYGPYSDRRGLGKIAEGFSGATNLTGVRGEAPVQPGYSLADATTATFGVVGTMLALFARERGAEGQLVDLALYEGLLRLIEWQFPLTAYTDVEVVRNGNAFPFEDAFITDIVRCSDERSVIVSAATSLHLARLRTFLEGAMGVEGLDSSSAVVDELRRWAGTVTGAEVIEALTKADLVAGPILSADDLLNDPHIKARENVISVPHPDLDSVIMPGVVPKLSATPGGVRRPAPRLGADAREIMSNMLGLESNEVEEILASGAVQMYQPNSPNT
jgi:crotonobetainyl-CoA:carnitine CoA-transferase CaiB-like acyl-CoA transferase